MKKPINKQYYMFSVNKEANMEIEAQSMSRNHLKSKLFPLHYVLNKPASHNYMFATTFPPSIIGSSLNTMAAIHHFPSRQFPHPSPGN